MATEALDDLTLRAVREMGLKKAGGMVLVKFNEEKKEERLVKTALLFNIALKAFARRKCSVLILCNKKDMETHLPEVAQLLDVKDPAFDRISMKYVSGGQEILKYFAKMHMYKAPSLIIVDRFTSYFSSTRIEEHVKCAAILRNALDHANALLENHGNPMGCRVIATSRSYTEPFCDLSTYFDFQLTLTTLLGTPKRSSLDSAEKLESKD
ncbi:hypothetical protein AAMO2058_000609300 [Amorphochlora amoebiformis]